MIKHEFDACLVSASMIGQLRDIKFTKDIIVIAVDDNLDFVPEYNYWSKLPEPKDFAFFRELADCNPDKIIVLIIPGDHWNSQYFEQHKNIRVINWYPFNENDTYATIAPVEKNFNSNVTGICLSRQMRSHRYALISYLLGKNYDNFFHISAMHLYKQLEKIPSNDLLDHLDWQFDPEHDTVKQIMCLGFKKLYSKHTTTNCFQKPTVEAYPMSANGSTVLKFDNKTNFDNNLRPLYANSFVELVNCRLYSEPTVSIDEKYINTIYARNFPVFLGSNCSVQILRESGLDMFDDIVDHTYDTIQNPIDRLVSAVESNYHLISNPEQTKKLWLENQHRFDKNIEFAKNTLYKYYDNISMQRWKEIMSDLLH